MLVICEPHVTDMDYGRWYLSILDDLIRGFRFIGLYGIYHTHPNLQPFNSSKSNTSLKVDIEPLKFPAISRRKIAEKIVRSI
jgi:hypothetical protein